jgi:phosphoglucomutase
MIDRVAADLGRGWSRCRSASSGSCPACSTGPARSAARSRPARPSCAPTARCGRPTRTASCWPCSRPRSSPTTGKSPSEHYAELTARHGDPAYARIDAAPTASRRPSSGPCPRTTSPPDPCGEPITAKLTEAPGNGAAIGGLKVVTESAWFAARPSGTEDVYKIYAESFRVPSTWRRCRPRPARS